MTERPRILDELGDELARAARERLDGPGRRYPTLRRAVGALGIGLAAAAAVAVLVLALVTVDPHERRRSAMHQASALRLVPGVGIGGVRIGETRAEVERALGPGWSRTVSSPWDIGLGACGGRFCRAYRVSGAVLSVDYSRTNRVENVLTQYSGLVVGQTRMSAGLPAVRHALKGWRALSCQGGGWILLHTGPRGEPVSTLSFHGQPFWEASVGPGPAPSGCSLPASNRTTPMNDRWWVLETGPGARSIVLQYFSQNCAAGPAQPVVQETDSTVSIEFVQPVGGYAACLDMIYLPRVTIHLRVPLAGRLLTGFGLDLHASLTHPQDDVTYLQLSRPNRAILPEVPRVLGLSPQQAVYVLAKQGFRARIVGIGSEIVAQNPARGQVPKSSRACCSGFAGDVELTAGP